MLDIATPSPRRGEVLVRVIACGVCHTDLHVIKGEVAFPRPAVMGHEVSGTIAALGDGLEDSGLRVGQDIISGFIMPCTECAARSEEHTSELQSLMRISYAVFCLKKQKHFKRNRQTNTAIIN